MTDFIQKWTRYSRLDVLLLDPFAEDNPCLLDHLFKIRRLVSNHRTVILTSNSDASSIFRGLGSEIHGYILKDRAMSFIGDEVAKIHRGRCFLDVQALDLVLKFFGNQRVFEVDDLIRQLHSRTNPWELTARELQIARGLAENKMYKEIAEQYFISINTVRYYIKSLYSKLGVSSRKELIYKLGISIQPQDGGGQLPEKFVSDMTSQSMTG